MSTEQIKAACPSCETRMFFDYNKALTKQSCSSCHYTFTVPKAFSTYILQVIKANDEFSDTYNALNKEGKLCRLRVFNNLISDSLHAQQALKLSVQKQTSLSSDHLVKIQNSFEYEDQFCVEYEFMKTSLKGHRQKQSLTLDQCLGISLQLLRAYDDLAKNDLIASNIKPSTISYVQDQVAFYDVEMSWPAAFELSKKDLGFNPVNNTQYVAPEVITERKVSAKSDLYSLGCVIYELFASHPPFYKEESANAQLEAHKNLKPESLRSFNNRIPESLDRLILSMLEKHPEHRPQIDDLISDLERVDLNPSKEILKEFAPSPSDTLVPKKTAEIDLSLLASERNLHPPSSVTPLEEDQEELNQEQISDFTEDDDVEPKCFPLATVFIVLIVIVVLLMAYFMGNKKDKNDDDRESLSRLMECYENHRST
ncbi:putative serine/threonine protein kinase [Lentisphaera araneosa HTCC2155]|uniref:non-specific serine/threonine protein kinase n=1 Tax=Lentisphaera araneosa HTCC2155 TaxID=313628 RepID=A6DTF6_9BACT|nr:protein kinase [Lentisphaera araneosa]EDM25060.1 putative serine/threonine protein kinase [Lentisphaera araneosa HTCC2155]